MTRRPQAAPSSPGKTMSRVERTGTRILGFQNPEMDFAG
jgi:hypothetical protein